MAVLFEHCLSNRRRTRTTRLGGGALGEHGQGRRGNVAKQVIKVPALTRRRAMQLGERGERWLAGLPDLVAELARQWSITLGPPLPGGNAAFVTWARTADGDDVVLKVAIPGPDFADQVRTIVAARGGDGRGRAGEGNATG